MVPAAGQSCLRGYKNNVQHRGNQPHLSFSSPNTSTAPYFHQYACKYHPPVHVQLENEKIWTEFSKFINENIVTPSGRRLFPYFNVLIDNLHPYAMYDIYVDFIERGCYTWTKSKSIKTDDASSTTAGCNCGCVQQQQAYLHRDSPNLGRFWMATPVSFAHLKLTHLTKDLTPNQITVKPMHMYEPRIRIVQRPSPGQANVLVHSQTFPIASFIAVTAYQNMKIPELKIKFNPFARVFWKPVKREQERPQTPPVSSFAE